MPTVSEYPVGEFIFAGTTPERASKPVGMIWGFLGHGSILGTGSQRILIQVQRAEFVQGRVVYDESGLAPGHVLRRIRRLTGLTWEELSIVMNVSRRSLHFWEAGQLPSQKHLAHLHRVAGLVDRQAKGNPVHMRNLLLKDHGGQNSLVLLREGQYEVVERRLADEKAFPSFAELPAAESRKRMPIGISLAGCAEDDGSSRVPGNPLKGLKPPKLRKD